MHRRAGPTRLARAFALSCLLAALLAPRAAAANARSCAAAPGGGLTLANVAAANGTVRAVGSNGLIARSRNLATWHLEANPAQHDLRGVVRTGDRWVAVGDAGTILYRRGGGWNAVPGLPNVGMRAVTAKPGLVAAAGAGGTLLTSPDGITWSQAPSGTSNILWGGTRVGSSLLISGQESTVIQSSNGASWTPVPTFPFATGNATAPRPFLWQLASRGGTVVAVGDFGAILVGTPATGLQAVTSPSDEILRGVGVTAGRWVAVGSGGDVLYSKDGSHWRLGSAPTTVDLRGVVWDGGRWVAVGDQSTVISSADGKAWRVDATAMPCALLGVAHDARRLVAVGGAGKVEVSTDGGRWQRVARPIRQDLYAVARGPGQFVAVGAKGAVLSSGAGKRWTAGRSGTKLNLHTVAWTGSRYLAGGDRGLVLTSKDGRRWKTVGFPAFHSVRSFATDGISIVAAGAGTVAQRPVSGGAWRLQDVGLGRFQTGVAYGDGRYVIVGHNGEVLVSADEGNSWSPETSNVDVNLDTVIWTGEEFLATGEGIAISSADGVTWQPVTVPTRRSVRSMTVSDGRVVAVGDDDTHFVLPVGP